MKEFIYAGGGGGNGMEKICNKCGKTILGDVCVNCPAVFGGCAGDTREGDGMCVYITMSKNGKRIISVDTRGIKTIIRTSKQK